ncbi:MAG: EamA family transporter [Gammaproteobacteria bacterium]
MRANLLFLIVCSVALSALAQLLLKLGMSNPHIQQAVEKGGSLPALWAAASNAKVIGGLGLYALGAVLWLLVLAKADLSFAYPFVGLGFIITMAFGVWVLHEPIGISRSLGATLVVIGVYLVARS